MTDDRLSDYLAHIRDGALLARSYVENMRRKERSRHEVTCRAPGVCSAALQHRVESDEGHAQWITHGYFDVDLEIVWETVGMHVLKA